MKKPKEKYEGLGAGDHVIEIRDTGERNPRASNCFVNFDGLVVEQLDFARLRVQLHGEAGS